MKPRSYSAAKAAELLDISLMSAYEKYSEWLE